MIHHLRGMSWDHPRGRDSVVATAEAYVASNPGVSIEWQTRSLQDFADYPVKQLAESFDLILVDHPFMGFAAMSGCFLPVEQHLDDAFLADQATNCVGPSHASYLYGAHQWALAVDAASQVSSYRPDLMERVGVEPPRSWEAVLALARARKGAEHAQVAVPLIPVDTLMCFCSLCAHAGEDPFVDPNHAVSRATGRHALETLRELAAQAHPESTSWNPIRAYDRMSASDEIAYIPLAFGYSNYARPGFRPHLIRFADVPAASDGVPRGAILGGVGLAISAQTQEPEVAFAYAHFVASLETQRGVFFQAGGQPGHRAAWLDPAVNAASSNFFLDTLATLDSAFLRPRYLGWMEVQDEVALILHRFLVDGGEIEATLEAVDAAYRGRRRD